MQVLMLVKACVACDNGSQPHYHHTWTHLCVGESQEGERLQRRLVVVPRAHTDATRPAPRQPHRHTSALGSKPNTHSHTQSHTGCTHPQGAAQHTRQRTCDRLAAGPCAWNRTDPPPAGAASTAGALRCGSGPLDRRCPRPRNRSSAGSGCCTSCRSCRRFAGPPSGA